MNLTVSLPSEILVEQPVRKIKAEAEFGSFCLLPRHVDFITPLEPGIFSYVPDKTGEGNREEDVFLATDGGTLVKCGRSVSVAARRAVKGPDLERLEQTVREEFEVLDEREKKTRTALASLQSNFVKRLMEMESRE